PFITSMAAGWRRPGSVPALQTSVPAGARARARPSAIWLRAELCTHRKTTRLGGAETKGGGCGVAVMRCDVGADAGSGVERPSRRHGAAGTVPQARPAGNAAACGAHRSSGFTGPPGPNPRTQGGHIVRRKCEMLHLSTQPFETFGPHSE